VLALAAAAFATLFAGAGSASSSKQGAPAAVLTAGPAKTMDTSRALNSPPLPASAFINRPTMPLATYRALKAAAGSAADRRGVGAAPAVPNTVASSVGFNGIAQPQAQSGFPSDSNGAVSASQIAEVVNQHLTTYNKTGTQTSDRSFATLTGYTTTSLFDPRIIYDPTWQRYVAVVDASPRSSTLQNFFLLISKTSSAAGSWLVYNTNVASFCGGTSPFFDYPAVGQTQDAIVFTGNCFNSSGYGGARVIGLAKAIIYNGLSFNVPLFTIPAADGTTTPANVYDQNPNMELLTRDVHEVTFANPQAGFYASITGNTAISGFFTPSVPRSAGQAGCTATSCLLDTGDGRFVQDSTQFGDQLWNVATYAFSGSGTFATPFWGQFSIAGASTTQRGDVIASSCSDDFNASLVVSSSDTMWLNWTSTNPQGSSCGGTFARQMEAGRLSSTATGTVTNKINPFTSPAELTGNFDPNFGHQRWGDTSSLSLDPSSATTAWSLNNSVANTNDWGTRWQKVTNS
jgi:hypothetical protein